ncbi:MAG: AtpZ/AtpI family protein [Candidatus Kerfeldbacteria bacterium]|nr:AtpZ/AtpI family protein [Candidatus Kerfeldbacteria bacterium]
MSASNNDKSSIARTLALLGNLGFNIAVPLVVLAILGRALDQRWGTSPWLLLLGIGLSLVVSSFLVMKRILPLLDPDSRNNDPPSSTNSKHSPPTDPSPPST